MSEFTMGFFVGWIAACLAVTLVAILWRDHSR